MYVKDLRVINRDLSQMVIIDNAAYSFAFQVKIISSFLKFKLKQNNF